MDPELESSSSRSDDRQQEDNPPPTKKIKTGTVRRKPACQTCRRRKVRCDNAQPTCGFCRANDTRCVYVPPGDDGSQKELNTVLERLDTLSHTVENIQRLLNSKDTPHSNRPPETRFYDRQVGLPIRAAEWQKDYLQIPAGRGSADTVLTWPIFQGQFRDSSLITTLFQHSHGIGEDRPTEWTLPEGLQFTPDEQIPTLVDRFIQNVHTKNPILDLESLIRYGRTAAEIGLQWDAQSCLVLLACALGCISQPFASSTQGYQTTRSSHDELGWRTPGITSSSDTQLREGEAFFMMACRRIGLLRYSVIGAQCHFFAGVYLMYTFRSLSAWNHFYQASTFYRLRLRLIDGLDKSAYVGEQQGTTVVQRLEQSLYWSCFKSEVEIRVELPLPQSAIAEYEYPALFPTPPTLPEEYPRHRDQTSDWTNTESLHRSPDVDQSGLTGWGVCNHISKLFNEEQSWYYYLTELALRRIGNRVLNAFYRDEPSTWSNIKPLIPIALEFDSQINTWFSNLPPTMQFYESDPRLGNDRQGYAVHTQESISMELSWALSNRFLEIRLWLYQPFLFFAVHHPTSTTSTSTDVLPSSLTSEELGTVQRLVESGLDCSMKILQARCLRHRHHGIWFDLRALVTASLICIALARSGNVNHPNIHPGGLRNHLNRTLETLAYWEDEAPDIKKARGVLEQLLRDLR